MTKNVTILNSVSLDFGVAEIRDDGILTFEPTPKSTLYTLKQLEEMLYVFKEMTNGKPHLYFSNNEKASINLGNEEKSFMGKHFHEFATAFAMTEQSALTRFTAHTFIYLNRPKIPIKMFKKKENAIAWLNSLNI